MNRLMRLEDGIKIFVCTVSSESEFKKAFNSIEMKNVPVYLNSNIIIRIYE